MLIQSTSATEDARSSNQKQALRLVLSFVASSEQHALWFSCKLAQPVERSEFFTARGVDLQVVVKRAEGLGVVTVHIQADPQPKDALHLALDLVGDPAKKTQSEFLSTEAEWYFYVFTRLNRLLCIPTARAQDWAHRNAFRFPESQRWTEKAGITHKVPVRMIERTTFQREIPGIIDATLIDEIWEMTPRNSSSPSETAAPHCN